MLRLAAVAVFVVGLAALAPTCVVGETQASWLDISGVSYDEECLVYTLQGLANREQPRLMLDTASIFWSWPAADRHWRKYLEEQKGFRFQELGDLRAAIAHFRPDIKGLVVYDPGENGSRYVAITMAALRGLLPVTPDILAYRSPALSSRFWTGDDMTDPSRWYSSGALPELSPDGVRVVETSPTLGYGAVDRKLTVDLERAPLVEIEVVSCTERWALKVNEGTAVDAMLQAETAETGTFRYDLREVLTRAHGSAIVRIFTVGEGSSMTVRSLRLLDANGEPVPPDGGSAVECFADLPVVEDLRGRFASDLAACQWALENLLPQCDRRLAFSAGHTHEGAWLGGDPAITIGLDYAVARKAFAFNLSPVATGFESYGHRDPNGFPEQAALFTKVMESLERPAAIYGWAEPEGNYCDRVSRGGNYIMCCGAPNTSFWAKVPAEGDLRLPRQAVRSKPLENKYYITFQTNEGDTPKIVSSAFCGAWADPARGSVPIAWGVNPLIGREFPGLWEYFVRTATPNDSFFAGCSGAGYCYAFHMPNFEGYARHVGALVREFGPRVIDVWESGMRLDMYEKFREATGTPCFTQQTMGAATNNWLPDGTPVLTADSHLYYYNLDPLVAAEDLAERVRNVAKGNPAPFFIVCYGGVGPGLFGFAQGVQKLLPPDQYEIIGADDMADLARQAGQFSAQALALGVSPGKTLDLMLALRNPDGDAGQAGRVTLELPAGWSAEPAAWEHGSVPTGGCLEQKVTLTAGGDARGGLLATATDSRTGAVRRVPISVYAETQVVGDFTTGEGWRETGASLRLENGQAIITTSGPYASVQRTVEIDFDREPVLEVDVARCEGAWALKLNDGTMPVDVNLKLDGSATGLSAYDLTSAVGWKGRKSCEVIVFAIGPGTSTTVNRVAVHYRR